MSNLSHFTNRDLRYLTHVAGRNFRVVGDGGLNNLMIGNFENPLERVQLEPDHLFTKITDLISYSEKFTVPVTTLFKPSIFKPKRGPVKRKSFIEFYRSLFSNYLGLTYSEISLLSDYSRAAVTIQARFHFSG